MKNNSSYLKRPDPPIVPPPSDTVSTEVPEIPIVIKDIIKT